MRLIAPFLASVLVVVLLLEMTDLVCFSDESGHEVATHEEGGKEAEHDGAHGHHAPVNDEHRSEHLPDCLCHVVLVEAPQQPVVGEPTELEFAYPGYLILGSLGEGTLPDHVPIG